ncbi:MAG: sulfur carrier protein ThiS [bacterium]
MEVIVNGMPRDISDGSSLLDLLNILNLNPDTTIVELNREVAPKDAYADQILRAGDKIELVRLVGGG